MQFIISVALHVCPLICATKEKQTMMVTVLCQIRKSNITPFFKNSGLRLEGFVHIRWDGFSIEW